MLSISTTLAKKRRDAYRYAVIIMCLFASQHTAAMVFLNDTVQPYVATQLTYDNNVLRLPKNFTPDMSGNRASTSSFIKQLTAGLAIKWQFSQQQLIADVSVNKNWYSTYNDLNYTGHYLMGQWNWQLTPKFKGELTYSNRLAIADFGQINRFILNNLENQEVYLAGGRYEFIQNWFLRAQFTRDSIRYNASERDFSNLRETSKEFGVRYVRPFGNTLENMLGFRVTITDGLYPTRGETSIYDNAYTSTTYGIEGRWQYSIKTRLRADIGYVSQEFKHIKELSFTNFVARGDILWEATSKTSFFLEIWREISSADSLTSIFVLTTGVALTPKWTWSESSKIQVELPMSYAQQDSIGELGLSNNPTLPATKSNQSDVRLNLNYAPRPNIEMTAFAAYQSRHSSNPLNSYSDEILGFNIKVSF